MVQMAIVALIIGVTVAASLPYLLPKQDLEKDRETMERQQIIARAISTFAQRYNRIPCPADPGATDIEARGRERNKCYAGANNTSRVGTVPYRALGLNPQMAYDAYGNLFTYAVQRNAAMDDNVDPMGQMIYGYCRVGKWQPVSLLDPNANPRKALFCCGIVDVNETLPVMNNFAGTSYHIPQPQTPNSPQQPMGGNPTGGTVGFSDPGERTRMDYVAYVLVSHGRNGQGAYEYGSSTHTPFTGTYGQGAGQAEDNNDTNNYASPLGGPEDRFVDIPLNLAYNNPRYFDDIVLWRTQNGVMEETNDNSCEAP